MEFVFGEHSLDVARRELRRGGELVALEPQVCDLLIYLIENRDRAVSRDDLLDAVWGGRIVSEPALTTRINAVRKAVGDSGAAQHLIRTLPRRGFRFVGVIEETRKPAAPAEAPPVADEFPVELAPAPPDKPSIAVLPFTNMSSDPEQDHFADGMAEEIITALSRIRWLFVIARNSTFAYKGQAVDVKQVGAELGVRYVLEGSVRKSRGRVRITGQLIDAVTGAHLWADRFDGALDDIFELQDKVANSVAGVIEPTLRSAEIRRTTERRSNDLTAYDLDLRAQALGYSWEQGATTRSLGLLEQAIERDPQYGPALAQAAERQFDLHVGGWTDDPEATRRKGIELSRRALQVAGDDPEVLSRAGFVLGYFGEEIDVAVGLVERSLKLNPNAALGWRRSAWLRLWDGQPDRAIEHFEASLRLNPLEQRANPFMGIGIAHFFARRFEEAKAILLQSLQEKSSWVPTYRFLASCYAHMGRFDEAREIIQRLSALTNLIVPNAEHWRDPADRELYLSGLRLAAGKPQ